MGLALTLVLGLTAVGCSSTSSSSSSSASSEGKDSGVKEIVVSDNGIGMDREDAKMAFLRHATCKLKKLLYVQETTQKCNNLLRF